MTQSPNEVDVLICGASFAGLAVARELAGCGASVLVVDRYELGERATSACAAPTPWLLALGLTDALRATTDADGLYTFWDYQAGGWQKNNGIRIDHLLLSPEAAGRLQSVVIDKAMRGRDKASDHTPIRIDLAL